MHARELTTQIEIMRMKMKLKLYSFPMNIIYPRACYASDFKFKSSEMKEIILFPKFMGSNFVKLGKQVRRSSTEPTKRVFKSWAPARGLPDVVGRFFFLWNEENTAGHAQTLFRSSPSVVGSSLELERTSKKTIAKWLSVKTLSLSGLP